MGGSEEMAWKDRKHVGGDDVTSFIQPIDVQCIADVELKESSRPDRLNRVFTGQSTCNR